MTKALEEIPGISVGFQFPVQMRFNELMTGARQDVVCKIFGEDLDSLTSYASRLGGMIRTVKGAVNIYEERVNGMPQVVIKYNRAEMAKHGLNVVDINRMVNTAFAGQVAGQVYEGEKRFDMIVRLAGEARKNIGDIQALMIPTRSGTQIPLYTVAQVEEIEGVNQIQREDTKRRIIVGFNVEGRDVQSIVQELQTKVQQDLKLPKGYKIVYGGSFENMTAAKARLSIVVPIALLLIFLLLYFAFNSARQGLLIYSAIPLSAIGGILALYVRDLPFSISAGVGFIALFGVAVLNGILLVTEFNRLKKQGWADPSRIVIHATKSKLRAVLMTALVPSLGFIPMAVSTGAGGGVQKPLATVVIGGLIVSTLLTLFVLPLLYVILEKGIGYLKPKTLACVLLLACTTAGLHTQAQEKVPLKAALDSALKNNSFLKVSKSELAYQRALQKSGFDPEPTSASFEYGKFNSLTADNKLSISQTLQFPTVYTRQAALLKTTVAISRHSLRQNEMDLVNNVKSTYYKILILQDKHRLLEQADSIYTAFSQRSRQRFDAGDVDAVELATAENQRLQIANQLTELTSDYEVLLNQFNLLLNCRRQVTPADDPPGYPLASLPALAAVADHPLLRLRDQQIQLARQQYLLEKSRLLPSLTFGYNSSTLIGFQTNRAGDDQYFGGNKRFSSLSIGVGVPVFFGAQRSRIRAADVQILQRRQELIAASEQLTSGLASAIRVYHKSQAQVSTYRASMLPNASKIISATTDKLHGGDIGYLEWVTLINQCIQIRNDYYNTLQQQNEAAFEIERLSAINDK